MISYEHLSGGVFLIAQLQSCFTEFEAVNYINDHTCEKDGGPLEIFYID